MLLKNPRWECPGNPFVRGPGIDLHTPLKFLSEALPTGSHLTPERPYVVKSPAHAHNVVVVFFVMPNIFCPITAFEVLLKYRLLFARVELMMCLVGNPSYDRHHQIAAQSKQSSTKAK